MKTTQRRPTIFELHPRVVDDRFRRPLGMKPGDWRARRVIRSMAGRLLANLKAFRTTRNPDTPVESEKVIVCACTANQKKALEFVLKAGGDWTVFVSDHPALLNPNDRMIHRGKAWLRGLTYEGCVLWDAIRHGSSMQRRSIPYGYDEYLFALGLLAEWRDLLRAWRPRAVIVSNDYTIVPRTLLWAAKMEGVRSYFIPHALLGRGFYRPQVPVADVSFLANEVERRRLEERAREAGAPSPDIRILPRYVRETTDCPSRPPETIGLSLNIMDDIEKVAALTGQLTDLFPWVRRVLLRPHPAMRRALESVIQAAKRPAETHYGDLVDYFCNIDLHIAGATMMHLESVSRGVPTLMFPNAEAYDHYGFTELGVAEPADCPLTREDIPRLLDRQRKAAEDLLADPSAGTQGEMEALEEIFGNGSHAKS